MEDKEKPPFALTFNGEPITFNGQFITVSPRFIGREADLYKLNLLVSQRRGAVSITGIAGIGKTALARHFLSQQRNFITEWIDVEHNLNLDEDIDNLLVRIRLAEGKSEYLVVLDGVESLPNDEIQRYISRIRNYKRVVTVILTSRRSLVEIGRITEFVLEPLSQRELLELEFLESNKKENVIELPGLLVKTVIETGKHTSEGKIVEMVTLPWFNILKCIEKDHNTIYQIPPDKWEEIIAGAYKRSGFDEVILTPRSGDYGRDVIAIKKGIGTVRVIDQVKAYKPGNLVDANDVRALMGVLQTDGASKGFVTTTSDFAPRIKTDPLITPFMPSRLELINGEALIKRLLEIDK